MKGEKYLFVVSGPSGTGKDTVVAKLLGSHPEIEKTVSATTRTMREGEVNGKNYHFLTRPTTKLNAMPSLPARPVRPIRCT